MSRKIAGLVPGNLIGWVASLLIYLFVAARKLVGSAGEPSFNTSLLLLNAFLLLYLAGPIVVRRFRFLQTAYFLLQMGIILGLGLQQPYEDTWAALFIPLGYQAFESCSQRVALAWAAAFTACMTVTLTATFGLWLGLGYSLNYLASGFFLISLNLYFTQVEAARRTSQDLINQLRQARRRLEDYAAQAEEQAALQEQNNLARELHDSVSQTLFSISLTAQSARILFEKEPQRVPELLNRLQEMTSSALSQMRTLITQLRSRRETGHGV